MEKFEQWFFNLQLIKWCYANDIKAHYYIIGAIAITAFPLTFIIRHLYHLGIWNYILATIITFIVSTGVICGRELLNKSGWSNKDVFNGYAGWFTFTVVAFICTLITHFILSFYIQF